MKVIVTDKKLSEFKDGFTLYLEKLNFHIRAKGVSLKGDQQSKLICEVALQNYLATGTDKTIPLNYHLYINYVSTSSGNTEVHVGYLALSEDLNEAFFIASQLGDLYI